MVQRPLHSAVLALAIAGLAAGALAGCGSSAKDDDGTPAPQSQPSGLKNGGNVAQGTKKG